MGQLLDHNFTTAGAVKAYGFAAAICLLGAYIQTLSYEAFKIYCVGLFVLFLFMVFIDTFFT